MQILRVEPEPEHHQVTEDGVIYGFQRVPHADSVKVVFHVEYEGGTSEVVGPDAEPHISWLDQIEAILNKEFPAD